MPDGVHSYRVGHETYIVTANEGDAREWGDYVEPARVRDLGTEDAPGTGPLCENLEDYDDDAALGRLEVTTEMGFDEQQGCYSELYAFGGRSFSIYSADGELVFDSGAEFEELSARLSENTPLVFNSGHDDNEFDSRSDAKGVEPENLTIGEVDGRSYAFIGFERLGGVIVYDVTDPAAPSYVEYINNRSFDVSLGDEYEALEEAGASEQELAELVNSIGDLGPEGLDFISAERSPTGVPMIVVGNEVTGSTTLYTLDGAPTAPAEDPVPEPTETAAPTPEPTETAAPAPSEEPAPAPSEEPAPAPSEKPSQEPTPAPAPGGDPAPSENPTQQPTPSEEPLAPTGGGVAWGLGAGAVALVAAGIVLAARTRRA